MTDYMEFHQLGHQVAGLQGRMQSVQAQEQVPSLLTRMLGILEEFEARLRDLEPEEEDNG